MRGSVATLLLVCACVTARPVASPPIEAELDPERLLASLREAPAGLAGSRIESASGAKGDLRQVYRRVAPATVIVRAGASYGSGVVFDARGYVLTNHHVVARAPLVDLKAKVQLQRGRLSPAGVMTLDEAPLWAWVLKSDPLLDLAVLQVIDPPADLAVVKLSKRDPTPGQPVAALGHGAIGLLWAIKDGEVASVGKLATHLASLVGSDCVVASGSEAAAPCRAAGASVEQERKRLEARVPGLVVQSSCSISPGDSGGPLVDLTGELVGVNAFLKTDPRAGVATSFHVHLAEVRRFLEAVPAAPEPRLPSPWDLLPPGGAWADVDGDGRDDLYTAGLGARAAFVINASQRAVPAGQLSRLAPDAVLAQVDGQWLGWFDRDGDGTFDRVVLSGQGGAPGKAFALVGRAPGAFLGAASLLDPELLPSPRWGAIARELEGELSPSTAPPPDPLAGLKALVARDLDADGRPDAVVARRGAGSAIFIDPTGSLFTDQLELLSQLKAQPAAVRIVRQPSRTWIFVGGTRIFETTNLITVERAYLVGADGALVPAPELRSTDWRGLTLASFAGRARERVHAALAAFSLTRSVRPPATFPIFGAPKGRVTTSSAPNLPHAIVMASEGGQAVTMAFLLDGPEATASADRQAWAEQGFPGAGFVWSSLEGVEWFQYDTDADGRLDAMVIRRGGRQEGRRVTPTGVEDAPGLAAGPPLKPSLLRDPARASRLRALATEAFAAELIEP